MKYDLFFNDGTVITKDFATEKAASEHGLEQAYYRRTRLIDIEKVETFDGEERSFFDKSSYGIVIVTAVKPR